MAEKPIAYEPHPVTPERKAELVAQGFRILDAAFKPPEAADEPPEAEAAAAKPPRAKRRDAPPA